MSLSASTASHGVPCIDGGSVAAEAVLKFRVTISSKVHPMLFAWHGAALDLKHAINQAIGQFEIAHGPVKGWMCIAAHTGACAQPEQVRS